MPCDQQPSGEKEAKLTKQRRYLNCWHSFTKKGSPDLPELDALLSYFPGGIRVSLYPHPHWPGFRNKLPRTGVCVFWGRAALISLGNSWDLTFPTVGEMQMLRGDLGAHWSIYPSLSLMPLRFMCVNIINSGSSSRMIPFGLFLWKLTKVSGINNSTATAGGLKAVAEHHSLVCHHSRLSTYSLSPLLVSWLAKGVTQTPMVRE